jgi:enoyl-CoA hydratase
MDDGRANAMGSTMLTSLRAAFANARDAAAVLLTGRPRVFCGGLDLLEVGPLEREELFGFLALFHDTMRAVYAFPRPVVVAAAGSAVAGGAILLCCGDERIGARDEGVVGANEVRLGIPFPASAMEMVASVLSRVEASRALLFGDLVGKDEALRSGWFHRLADPGSLEAEAVQRARDVATIPASAFEPVKRELRAAALARMDARRTESHEVFVDAWTGPVAQARIRQIVADLQARRAKSSGPRPASGPG